MEGGIRMVSKGTVFKLDREDQRCNSCGVGNSGEGWILIRGSKNSATPHESAREERHADVQQGIGSCHLAPVDPPQLDGEGSGWTKSRDDAGGVIDKTTAEATAGTGCESMAVGEARVKGCATRESTLPGLESAQEISKFQLQFFGAATVASKDSSGMADRTTDIPPQSHPTSHRPSIRPGDVECRASHRQGRVERSAMVEKAVQMLQGRKSSQVGGDAGIEEAATVSKQVQQA